MLRRAAGACPAPARRPPRTSGAPPAWTRADASSAGTGRPEAAGHAAPAPPAARHAAALSLQRSPSRGRSTGTPCARPAPCPRGGRHEA
eukprot:4118312-Lingulodinium_polyedra.AAC.1